MSFDSPAGEWAFFVMGMGFFDRLLGKRDPDPKPAVPAVEEPAVSTNGSQSNGGKVRARLVEAREKLEAKDLDGAKEIYEEILESSGERADVLVTISGDLGVNGYLQEIADLVGPRYDAEKHGPATGINLLQAYLALQNADAAHHVLDILFALNRPELEDRLYGFSNAIAELINSGQQPVDSGGASGPSGKPAQEPPQINMVAISKPIWSYGLESIDGVLPAKEGKLRRIAFAQLALPGLEGIEEKAAQPEEEMGRLCRALPLWLAETFYFSPHYDPSATVGVTSKAGEPGYYALFPTEWTVDNLRQLVNTTEGGLDYVFTGAMRQKDGDYELILRVWEVKKFRERKQFRARWTPATADVELAKLHEEIRQFMEWSPDASALAYAPPSSLRAWLETLGASITLFLAEKTLLPAEQLPDFADVLKSAGAQAANSEAESLAYLTLSARAKELGVAVEPTEVKFADTPLVAAAKKD